MEMLGAGYETKEKTIFRVNKNAENPFVMMDKRPIENDNLSWKAKGLLSYLLSRPDDWTVRMGDLVKRSTDGEYATRAAIKELIEAGHLVRKQGRTEGAKFDTVTYDVYEKPLRGFPQADNPQADNLALSKKDLSKNELNNTTTSDGNLFSIYEQNIGALTPMISDKITDAEEDYPASWIEEAIGIAVSANVRKWSYINGILKRWKVEGKGSEIKKSAPSHTMDNEGRIIAAA